MQELWIKKVEWDEKLEGKDEEKITKWLVELKGIENVHVSRCMAPDGSNITNKQLHIFVDASETAMAAVAYLRTVNRDDQVAVSFVCSKTKVAPINAISIPRLELLAAKIGAVLGRILSSCLGVDGESMLLWTDSNDVLGWIRNRSRMIQPFVTHRVSRIQENCENSRWLKVSSKDNPADLATRGLKASEFWNHSTWF